MNRNCNGPHLTRLNRRGTAHGRRRQAKCMLADRAGVAELVDAPDSKSGSGDRVRVRVSLPAPIPPPVRPEGIRL